MLIYWKRFLIKIQLALWMYLRCKNKRYNFNENYENYNKWYYSICKKTEFRKLKHAKICN